MHSRQLDILNTRCLLACFGAPLTQNPRQASSLAGVFSWSHFALRTPVSGNRGVVQMSLYTWTVVLHREPDRTDKTCDKVEFSSGVEAQACAKLAVKMMLFPVVTMHRSEIQG